MERLGYGLSSWQGTHNSLCYGTSDMDCAFKDWCIVEIIAASFD